MPFISLTTFSLTGRLLAFYLHPLNESSLFLILFTTEYIFLSSSVGRIQLFGFTGAGVLVFHRAHETEKYAIFKRVQFALYDLKYVINAILLHQCTDSSSELTIYSPLGFACFSGVRTRWSLATFMLDICAIFEDVLCVLVRFG